jgi:Helix-turn-helix domain
MNEIQIHESSEAYIKTEELAGMLRVRPDTIVDWSKRYPDFPALRLPGVLRMRVSEVEKWLEQFTHAVKLEAAK